MATFPSTLPDFQTQFDDQQEDLYLRSETDVGPGKTRKRYSGEARSVTARMTITGAERATLDNFYANNVVFQREDPKDDSVQDFRFEAAPQYQLRTGAESPNDRVWDVTLNLYRMP